MEDKRGAVDDPLPSSLSIVVGLSSYKMANRGGHEQPNVFVNKFFY
jgi:hypothetical protein